jgi:hypothetical protein
MASAFDTLVTVPDLFGLVGAAVESSCRTAGLVPQGILYSNALGGALSGGIAVAPGVASQVPAAAASVGKGSTVIVNMSRW